MQFTPKEPVELSLLSVLKMFLLIATILLVYKLFTLILLFFLGSMLTVMLEPACKKLQRLGFGRPYAVATVAIFLFAFLLSITVLLMPAVTNQIVLLATTLPQIRTDLLAQIPDRFEFKTLIEEILISPKLPDSNMVMEHVIAIFGGAAEIVGAFALVWIFSVYLLADNGRAFQWVSDFFPAPTRMKLGTTVKETSPVIAAYATGQFFMSVGTGLFSYFTLSILHVPGALALAALAGIFDIVPIVGFFVGLIPAAIIGYSVAPSTGIIVIGLYLSYHFLETYLIIPLIYRSRMKVSGLVVMLALLIGATTGGVLLALAILPIVASYPIIERIWLTKYLGRDVIDRHAMLTNRHHLSNQVKLWHEERFKIQRSSTLSNREVAKNVRKKILIVEDDADVRSSLQDILETEGYHVFVASNGNEALITLETVSSLGLVLMDVNMPEMDGIKLLEMIKHNPKTSDIPVVFLSAAHLDEHMDGVAGILHKPSKLEDVIRMVEKHYLTPPIAESRTV